MKQPTDKQIRFMLENNIGFNINTSRSDAYELINEFCKEQELMSEVYYNRNYAHYFAEDDQFLKPILDKILYLFNVDYPYIKAKWSIDNCFMVDDSDNLYKEDLIFAKLNIGVDSDVSIRPYVEWLSKQTDALIDRGIALGGIVFCIARLDKM